MVLPHAPQLKTRVEVATVVSAATGQTCNRTAHAADSPELLATIRTTIDESRGVGSRSKREIMTAFLIADFQVAAGLSPFNPMRKDSASAGAKLRENMR
jgi:hypothetical protein